MGSASDHRLSFEDLTAGQDGLVTDAQLLGRNWSKASIRWLIADGHLERARRGVLALPGLPPSTWRDLRAALLAAPDAVAYGFAAAGLLGFPGVQPGAVEIAGVRLRAPRLLGVRGHAAPTLTSADTILVNGMRCTSIYRTLCDLVGRVTPKLLKRMVDHVERVDRLHGTERILTCTGRIAAKRRPTLVPLLKILQTRPEGSAGDCDRTAEVLGWIAAAGIRLPVQQHALTWSGEVFVCDGAYLPEKVDIEVDDDWSHSTVGATHRDKRRDQLARRAGWEVVRVTPETTKHELLDHLTWALTARAA